MNCGTLQAAAEGDIADILTGEGSMVAAWYDDELAGSGTAEVVVMPGGAVAEVLGSLVEVRLCLVLEGVTFLEEAQKFPFDSCLQEEADDPLCTEDGFVVVAMVDQGKVVGYVARLVRWPHTGEVAHGRGYVPVWIAIPHKVELSSESRLLVAAARDRKVLGGRPLIAKVQEVW